ILLIMAEILQISFLCSCLSGVHVFQLMYGCEWDEETEEVKGYRQYGYDGEDFIALDLKKGLWIAPKPQAVITKHKWDHERANTEYLKNYFATECPEWLKKYYNSGRSSLMRKGKSPDLVCVSKNIFYSLLQCLSSRSP
uniref:MHC class I-like antigen recognition-like domain-containing protein n=1 Tax=Oryzias melastigma TaxID=30732 RepID=A0A3B3CNT7_ORYME